MPRILYKYLDIVGAKCMIGNQNLQFTNASQLNDPFDCHPKLIDYSNVPNTKLQGWIPKEWWIEKEENDALKNPVSLETERFPIANLISNLENPQDMLRTA